MNNLYLAHHGILGMKWGVRRYQNTDGTLTAAGKKRYLDTIHRMGESDAKKSKKTGAAINGYRQILDIRALDQTKTISQDPEINESAKNLFKAQKALDDFDYKIKDLINDSSFLNEKSNEIVTWIRENNAGSKVDDIVDAYLLEFKDHPLEAVFDMEYAMKRDFTKEYLAQNQAKYGDKLEALLKDVETAEYNYGKSVSDYFGGRNVEDFTSSMSTNEYSRISSAVYELIAVRMRHEP